MTIFEKQVAILKIQNKKKTDDQTKNNCFGKR